LVVGSASFGINAGNEVGGLVGDIALHGSVNIMNCYSYAQVNGIYAIGGLIGYFGNGSVTNCYSTGEVFGTGTEYVGGLIGLSRNLLGYKPEDLKTSFWDVETSGQADSAGGTGKTTAEMQIAGTFLDAGWDFIGETENGTEDIWWIDEGRDYPILSWELPQKTTPQH
jgi:hypothetical protein